MFFKKFLIMLISSILLTLSANAEENPPIKGIYTQLPEFKFIFDGEKVEVIEFFSFYCGHCYEFEKSILIIKGNFPKKIQWKNVPVYWGKGSSKPGEAYLLAEDEGKGEQMKRALFEALFIEKRDISDISVLESIGAKLELGFDFSRRLRAGDKEKEANAALIMMKTYSVEGTPALIIAGNLKVVPGQTHDAFRDNTITILNSILKK
ncbi:MAG: DsbA family protein [Nitrospirae bacterium]|nr:DsbA family protein [Nitrospirota bacterium]